MKIFEFFLGCYDFSKNLFVPIYYTIFQKFPVYFLCVWEKRIRRLLLVVVKLTLEKNMELEPLNISLTNKIKLFKLRESNRDVIVKLREVSEF